MIGNPLMLGSADYQITRSLRLRSSASAYLSRTPAGAGSQTTWTWSGWIKRGAISGAASYRVFSSGTTTTTYGTPVCFVNDTIDFLEFSSSSIVGRLTTTQVFRDPSAWYHIVVVWDSSNSTSGDRMRMYVNGSRVTTFSTATYPSLNATSVTNGNTSVYHGALNYGGLLQYFDGYMAEVNFIDGQALTPSSFGETDSVTGVWLPKKFTGTYGTNGFYLPFTDNSGATATTIGKDFSGNSNNWTPNNISVTSGVTYDSMTDVPTLTSPTAANFPVMNPLDKDTARGTLDNANLRWYYPTYSSQNSAAVRGTMGVTSGKWYFESQTQTLAGIGNNSSVAFTASTQNLTGVGINYGTALSNYIGCQADIAGNAVTFVTSGYSASLASATTLFASYASNDVINVAIDFDNGKIWIGKNGTWYNSGNPATATNPTSTFTAPSGTNLPYFEAVTNTLNTNQSIIYPNFGQRPFAYTPPSGFVALNTFNLPTPAISAGNKHMNATLYTGNGSTQSIVNSGSMQPDLLWTKARSSNAWHYLQDSVRGVNKAIFSNGTDAEYSISPTTTTINSNGFSFNGGESGLNANTVTYVAWQWKANGAGSSNTAGSITSTVSANTTSGFSVVTYTGNGTGGTSVGHGLGATPSMYIIKARGATTDWMVYHISLGNNVLFFNTTAAATANSAYFSSYPNSTAFYLSTDGTVNTSTTTYVAYCFAPIAGFSAFGSYTGNGSTDGPFIYTGFRPRWILIKRTDAANFFWVIRDAARSPNNVINLDLYPNASDAENTSTANDTDFLSNGFKLRNTGGGSNTSAGTYIYAAFAENPFKYSLAR